VIKPRFLPAAEAELLKEVAYYSNVRDGLGTKFEQAFESTVKNAVSNPSGGAPAPQGTRSRLLKGFPFSVVYRASDTEILIVAVIHHRRKPGYWADRIA
jgi:plasmid stabilization system protein ParE